MTEVKIREARDGYFEINEDLAGLVPMMLDIEQEALTADIKENGQKEAIILWRGKIVDGRCRQKSCQLLNRDIKYRELEDDLTEEEVAIFVKSMNIRRNLTHTQKVMSAAKSYVTNRDKRTIPKIAESWGVSTGSMKNGNYLWRNYKTIAQQLFDGRSVPIVDSNGKEITSSSVSAIYAYIKRMEEGVEGDEKHGWGENTLIKTQAGKEWFCQSMEEIKKLGDGRLVHLMIELANYKYPEKEDDEL